MTNDTNIITVEITINADGSKKIRQVKPEDAETPYVCGSGVLGGYYEKAQILDDNLDFQGWLDSLNWDGCPSEDGADSLANEQWAISQAQDKGEWIVVSMITGNLMLVRVDA